jgi:hypothetical protein
MSNDRENHATEYPRHHRVCDGDLALSSKWAHYERWIHRCPLSVFGARPRGVTAPLGPLFFSSVVAAYRGSGRSGRSDYFCLLSAARLPRYGGPWLCAPASRRVCLFQDFCTIAFRNLNGQGHKASRPEILDASRRSSFLPIGPLSHDRYTSHSDSSRA